MIVRQERSARVKRCVARGLYRRAISLTTLETVTIMNRFWGT